MSKGYVPSVGELEAFVACARFGTTVQAAEHLNLTQSAISRSLSSLEDRLGVLLFERVRRRLVLSRAGGVLLERAEPLLDDLRNASASAIAFGGASSVLRLAVLPSIGRSWLIPRLAAFSATMPDVNFDIAARLRPVDFAQEAFDVAIMRSQHEPPGADLVALLREEMVIVASPRLLAKGASLDDRDLQQLPLLQQSTRPTLWLDWFRERELDPRRMTRGARFDHFDMILDAAAAGLGIGLIPELIARDALDRGALVAASPHRLVTGETYALISPERSRSNPAVTAFRAWLIGEIGQS
jgi:LysR family transcriptional regulator, glycine cleavage system transcriptional activator